MKTIAVLPARMGSSRFPGKPLAKICGITMIEHVYRRVAMAQGLDQVIVATCDNEIMEAVEAFGGRAEMTSSGHQRASDRVAEVATRIEADVFLMVQGDEPMVTPKMCEQAIAPMRKDSTIGCVNLIKRIDTNAEFVDPNTIKVIKDGSGNALYFSREPIPTARLSGFEKIQAYKQVCIIPFKKEVLLRYFKLSPTPAEKAESIDMMRFLENGMPVRLVETEEMSHAVDTPADLRRVEEMMRNDPLTKGYL